MRTQIDIGIFGYCGISDVESHLIFDVEGDQNAGKREAGLRYARCIAGGLYGQESCPPPRQG